MIAMFAFGWFKFKFNEAIKVARCDFTLHWRCHKELVDVPPHVNLQLVHEQCYIAAVVAFVMVVWAQ